MYVPYDEELGIHAQDEAFLQNPFGIWPILRQATSRYCCITILSICTGTKCANRQIRCWPISCLAMLGYRNYAALFSVLRKITTHDSSLSACVFSIVASQLGFDEKAAYYFGDSAKLDLLNTHGNTKDGLHTANLGGSYMAVVYGFGGLRLYEDRIDFNPKLPRGGWTGYGFQITYRGSGIHVQVETGRSRFRLTSGMPAMIRSMVKNTNSGTNLLSNISCKD